MAEAPGRSSRQRWTLVLVCTAAFMLLLDITIVSVALPSIQRDLRASLPDLQWVSAAPYKAMPVASAALPSRPARPGPVATSMSGASRSGCWPRPDQTTQARVSHRRQPCPPEPLP